MTPIRCAANAFFHHDIREGDTVAWPTNLGWMMGPWLVFAALLNGATIALFQGSPLGRAFGVFVQQAGVTMLGLVPSIAKTWRATNCMQVMTPQPAQQCNKIQWASSKTPLVVRA